MQVMISQALSHATRHCLIPAGDGFVNLPTQEDKSKDAVVTDANGVPVPTGEDASVLELFRKKRGPWTQSRPFHQISLKPEFPQHQAIVVRMEDPEGNGAWCLHSISIRSRHIRRILAEAFQDYPGINTDLEDLTFDSPFHEFFFRWSRIRDILEHDTDQLATNHTALLLETLQTSLQSIIDRAADMSRLGVIDFELLWTLYEPTSEVFLRLDGYPQLALVNETGVDDKGNFFVLCRVIDFDGDTLGFKTIKQLVRPFQGVKAIIDLPIHPSHRHPEMGSIMEKLRHRGRKFLAHCTCRYVQYSGFFEEHGGLYGPTQEYVGTGRGIFFSQY